MSLTCPAGRWTQLTFAPGEAYAPELSPDNRRIVFTHLQRERQSIWVMGRQGSDPHPLFMPPRRDAWDPVWSPDGGQILFASNMDGEIQLYTINPDGSGLRQVTDMGGLRGRSDWSPDGASIATYAGVDWSREIILMDVNGENVQQITNGGNNLAPSFSPDGGWIAYTSYQDHYRDENGCEIYTMRVDGSQITRLTDNDYCDWQPRWGP